MMKLDRHEADSTRTYLGDPHSPLFRRADVLYRPPLIFSPVWMLSPEDIGTQRLLERREGRRPRPQREVNYRLGVSIVEWSDPQLDGLYLRNLDAPMCVNLDENVAPVEFNYRTKAEHEEAGTPYFTEGEQPGCSVFVRDGERVFHIYSTFARGIELLNPTTQFIDLTPLGR